MARKPAKPMAPQGGLSFSALVEAIQRVDQTLFADAAGQQHGP